MGRGLLAMAGMVSGAGQEMAKGLGTIQATLGQSYLQDERDKLERARLELTEGYAAEREKRGYAHGERLQAQGFGHAERLQQENQTFTKGENELTRKHDLTKQDKGFDHDTGERKQDRDQAKTIADMSRISQETIARENRASTEGMAGARNKLDEGHYKSVERVALAQLRAHKDEVSLQPQADGSFVKVTRDGRVLGVAIDPETKKPLNGGRDLPAATKVLAEVNMNMIKIKGKELENQTLLPEERGKLQNEMDKLKQETEILLGKTPAAKPTIVDPDAPAASAGDGGKAKAGKSEPVEKEMTDDEAAAAAAEGDSQTKTELARERAGRYSGLITKDPESLFSRWISAITKEAKRQLSPSTTKPKMTLADVENFIRFKDDPKTVAAFIARFGSEPSEADYEALKLSKQRK